MAAPKYPDTIVLDADTLKVLTVITEAHDALYKKLDELAEVGNGAARSISADTHVRYEDEPWCVVGQWNGDWAEAIVGEELAQRSAQIHGDNEESGTRSL